MPYRLFKVDEISKPHESEKELLSRFAAIGIGPGRPFNPADLFPAKLFWSFTMYGLPKRLLVDNEINRYSIGDRSNGLVTAKDGSLTIYIHSTPPEGDKKSENEIKRPGQPQLSGAFYLCHGPITEAGS